VPIVRPRLMLSDLLYRLTQDTSVAHPDYLELVIGSPQPIAWIEAEATGTSESMVKIGQGTIRDLRLPMPDTTTQRRLVDHVQGQWAAVDRLAAALVRQAALLAEHRRALIVAATTGRFDIVAQSAAA
jgi:type I restriction enzyme S subunit